MCIRDRSGGQKQRVGIARALAANPRILLADEATSALDPQTTNDVLRLLKKVNEELGITVVVITHEMDVVRKIADRVAVLDRGRLIEGGSVYDTFAEPRTELTASFVAAQHWKNRRLRGSARSSPAWCWRIAVSCATASG